MYFEASEKKILIQLYPFALVDHTDSIKRVEKSKRRIGPVFAARRERIDGQPQVRLEVSHGNHPPVC